MLTQREEDAHPVDAREDARPAKTRGGRSSSVDAQRTLVQRRRPARKRSGHSSVDVRPERRLVDARHREVDARPRSVELFFQRGSRPGATERAPGATSADLEPYIYLKHSETEGAIFLAAEAWNTIFGPQGAGFGQWELSILPPWIPILPFFSIVSSSSP
ncbi:hypothetical protein LR48_Vigan03g084800 [Vigna angularis]|uniref:Uncharacterized protein n=1 Tax=Phaseolus angularis TaxID=3914 RepID=A0A0L9U3X9_PHAAN|nr:hypothetical protein LR48_Vigan03g084800 [Vigna angularis]